jgi:ribonuclease BN (tRNA processing enzyme)
MRLILTGTGTPHPCLHRAGPSQIVEVAGQRLLFDCGEGTIHQLLRAGVQPQEIQDLFLTHLHLDHIAGLTGFVFGSFYFNLRAAEGQQRARLQVYGPEDTDHLFGSLRGAYRVDMANRRKMGVPTQGFFDETVHRLATGPVLERPEYRITAAPADHGIETFGFRIDYDGGSLVLSGDTTYAPSIVALARGADVLVHEAHMADERPTNPLYAPVWENIAAIHSTPEQAGRVAREAGVRRLIVTHLKPDIDASTVQRRCASEFDGEVIVAQDLMQIDW